MLNFFHRPTNSYPKILRIQIPYPDLQALNWSPSSLLILLYFALVVLISYFSAILGHLSAYSFSWGEVSFYVLPIFPPCHVLTEVFLIISDPYNIPQYINSSFLLYSSSSAFINNELTIYPSLKYKLHECGDLCLWGSLLNPLLIIVPVICHVVGSQSILWIHECIQRATFLLQTIYIYIYC